MDKSKGILQKQNRLFMALIAGATLLVILVTYLMTEDEKPQNKKSQMKVDLPVDKLNPQELVLSRVEEQNRGLEAKINYLEELILNSKKQEKEKEKDKREVKSEISKLKRELNDQKVAYLERERLPYEDPFGGMEVEVNVDVQVRTPLVEICSEIQKEKVSHVDRVIPSGTTVKAVLVSSIDATCGAFSKSDPQPVKLIILDDGHLPKGVIARIKGGIVIASVYGDLSSERVYIRVERLTQVKCNGEFVETDIAGFVTGEDGKYGVRGVVVDKSGKLIGNAAMSGFLSGVSEYFTAKALSNNCGFIDGCCEAPVGYYDQGKDIVSTGALYGTSNAFDMMTDYFIRRAEQIRPVIQVTAGRIVDITFTHGAEIGDLYTRERVKDIRDRSRQG